jgi:hypothetical protein
MGRRLLPFGLGVAAVLAQAAGETALAFYLVVAAVPCTAVSGLVAFGELVDRPGVARLRLETAVAALALVTLLVAALLVRA